MMQKKWLRRKYQIILFILILIIVIIYFININGSLQKHATYDLARRDSVLMYIDDSLQEAMKSDKGTGCQVPQLDPFAKDIVALQKNYSKITCGPDDWVKCFMSKCQVKQRVLLEYDEVECFYRDILYRSDQEYRLGDPVRLVGDQIYELRNSDHIVVRCAGKKPGGYFATKWKGVLTGFRRAPPPAAPPSLAPDVLILGFDSTSKNGFIRKMPRSWEYITKTLKATVLDSYNILGDGTPAALFPILSGKNELEFPDVRRAVSKDRFFDPEEFIFRKLRRYGYRTAYFEDSPYIGTFQYRFNGFSSQPADHYLRFYLMENDAHKLSKEFCVGGRPLFKIMMNITDQFLRQDGKHFCFTFIADICHDDFNRISVADEDTVAFLDTLHQRGTFNNTMLIVMGDHGPRYAKLRQTMQGKFEERLPLMAILLPTTLKQRRPEAQENLENNTSVLTTAHDIHATILDVLDLNHLRNPYRVRGSDLMRALSLIRPIPRSRSCSEAGIQPHWCTCVNWNNVSASDRLYKKMADEFVNYVNTLTEPFRDKCEVRTLKTIYWVMKQQPNSKLVAFVGASDNDGYIGKFKNNAVIDKIYYQLKISIGPSEGLFEASGTYYKSEDKFIFNPRDVSRINMYHDEPSCISQTHPELNMYCYCK